MCTNTVLYNAVMYRVLTLTTQITTQRRATRPEITWQPPCSSSMDILPVTWCGAPSSTSTHASRWGPIWGCPGVSGRSEHFTSTTTIKAFTVIMCQRRFPSSCWLLQSFFFFFCKQPLSVFLSPCFSDPGPALCAQLFLCGQQKEHVCLPGAYNQISLLPQVSLSCHCSVFVSSFLHWISVISLHLA